MEEGWEGHEENAEAQSPLALRAPKGWWKRPMRGKSAPHQTSSASSSRDPPWLNTGMGWHVLGQPAPSSSRPAGRLAGLVAARPPLVCLLSPRWPADPEQRTKLCGCHWGQVFTHQLAAQKPHAAAAK